MYLTRATVESILIRRCGKLLTACDLDGTTISGSNADLNDPVGWAVRQLGLTVANLTAVADGDLAGVGEDETDQLLDLAELRALESALTNFDATDIKVGQRDEKLDQIAKRLEGAINRKRAQIARDYGTGLGTLTAGVIALDFQEANEADDAEL